MALTRITKGVIKPNENYDTHDINSTGIITATGANITGNLSVGGVLTYEDVSSIDSVGIITANQGIHVGAGLSAVGVGTFSGADIDDFISVGSNIHLGSAGVVTATSYRGDGSQLTGIVAGLSTISGVVNVSNDLKIGTGVTITPAGAGFYAGVVTATTFDGELVATNLTGALPAISGVNLTNVNADTVDGIHAASFVRSDAIDDVTGTLTLNNNLLKFSGTSNDRTLIHFIKSNEIKWRLLQNSYNAGGGDNLNFDRVNGTGIFMVDGYRVLTTLDINAQASGAVHSGISTFQDIDVAGHTNLDNASIAGVVTATTFKSSSVDIDGGSIDNTNIGFNLRAHGLFNNVEASGYVRSTGHIKVADHIEHDGDSDTLIKFPAANTISFETAGSEKLRIASDGNMGLGTNSLVGNAANVYLTVNGSSLGGIALKANGTTQGYLQGTSSLIRLSSDGSKPITFDTNGSERIRITSNGRVGINSTVPSVPLDVVGSGKFSSALTVGATLGVTGTCTLGQTVSLNGTNPRLQFVDTNHDSDFSIYGNNGRLSVYDDTNSAERLHIGSLGQIGLSGANYGTSGQVLTSQGNSATPTWTTISGTTINNNADNRVITGSGTANTLEAESTLTYNAGSLVVNGKNSINTTSIITYSPGGDVRWQMGVNNSTGADLTSKNTSGSYNTYQINAGTFKVRTTGTNTPVERFTIDGNGKTSISVNKDSTALVIDGTSSGTYFGETGGRIEFLMNNEVNQFTGNFAARIAPYLDRSNNGFGLKFDVRYNASTTYKALDITSDYEVLPGSDNTISLGNSSYRWSNIYSADLQLSNIGTGGNEVDGTEGSWTLQEAEDTVYMINRINGKRYKIKMEEV